MNPRNRNLPRKSIEKLKDCEIDRQIDLNIFFIDSCGRANISQLDRWTNTSIDFLLDRQKVKATEDIQIDMQIECYVMIEFTLYKLI